MSDHETVNPSGGWNLASSGSVCAICCDHKSLVFECPSACVHICSDCMRSHVDTAISNNLGHITCPCCDRNLRADRIKVSASANMYTRHQRTIDGYERNISRANTTVDSTTIDATASTTPKQLKKRLGISNSIYATQPTPSKTTTQSVYTSLAQHHHYHHHHHQTQCQGTEATIAAHPKTNPHTN